MSWEIEWIAHGQKKWQAAKKITDGKATVDPDQLVRDLGKIAGQVAAAYPDRGTVHLKWRRTGMSQGDWKVF